MTGLALACLLSFSVRTSAPPPLDSWRLADSSPLTLNRRDLAKIRQFELDDACALSDGEAAGTSREKFVDLWTETFAGQKVPLHEFGKAPKGKGEVGEIDTTLWTQPAASDDDVIVLIDTSIVRKVRHSDFKGGIARVPIVHIRDMFVVSRKEAGKTVAAHVRALGEYLIYYWQAPVPANFK